MKKIQIKKIRTWREIEHNRGRLEEGNGHFHRLIIHASPENYDYSNWTEDDLKDLADAINAFLKEVKK